jgi:hypothetical protein
VLFHITQRPGSAIGPRALKALENMAQSAANGNHIVSGDRSLLEIVSEIDELSDRARSYYRRMAQNLTQLGRIIASIPRVEVDIGAEDGDIVNGIVSAGVLFDADYCEKAQLLVENLTDFEVLLGLARLLMLDSYCSFAISLRAQNGGGSTTHQVLKHIMSGPSGPVLCIVDSDQKYLGGAIGSTAMAVMRAARRLPGVWRMRLIVLPTRELENLIPADLRNSCTQDLSASVRQRLGGYDELDACYLDYCSMKEGDSRCRMLNDALGKRRYDLLNRLGAVRADRFENGLQCGTCPYPGGCFASPGLGARFLQKVARLLGQGGFVSDVNGWREELRSLVQQVVWAGCAFPVQRT